MLEIILIPLDVDISLIVLLLLREVSCWYFKINKQIKLQQLMLETMLRIVEQNGGSINWEEVKEILGKNKILICLTKTLIPLRLIT